MALIINNPGVLYIILYSYVQKFKEYKLKNIYKLNLIKMNLIYIISISNTRST